MGISLPMNCYSDLGARRNEVCIVCCENTAVGDHLVVERKYVHKECFKCGACGQELERGLARMDDELARIGYAFVWFCPQHANLPPIEKATLLHQRK